uniref:Uncharacterized protein n=1 Tax=Phytoplasma australiense TaxID=59748 RepID=Q0QLC2_PHYAS|nr:hypothetical protein [Candidatus Phytoplasma australiense]ABD04147.1 hypothetical protein [Candidatus Phytoplasma australiense]
MHKKRKLILKIWFIFLAIILFLLLLLLGLNLPKLPRFKSKQNKTQKQTQTQLETKNIYDFNYIENLIKLMNKLNNFQGLSLDKSNKQKQKDELKDKENKSSEYETDKRSSYDFPLPNLIPEPETVNKLFPLILGAAALGLLVTAPQALPLLALL